MATMVSETIDISKQATYPIVLSDALLGRGSKELFTGIRYNHKAALSQNATQNSHDLKPSAIGDSTNYELAFKDGPDNYKYKGIRKSDDDEYILVFDPERKQFVLHQVDSTFDMNMTKSPWENNPANLRKTYEQLQGPQKQRRKTSSQPKPKAAQNKATSPDAKRRKIEKAKPKPKKPKAPPREPTPDAEDEDSDDGLTIEYPGGPPPPRFQSRPSPMPYRLDDKVPSEESDADAEYEDEYDNDRNRDVDVLHLPSPAAKVGSMSNHVDQEAEEEEEVDPDLAAELEQALESETGARADESSESEEE